MRNKINYAALLLCVAAIFVFWRISSVETPDASESQTPRSQSDVEAGAPGGGRPNASTTGRLMPPELEKEIDSYRAYLADLSARAAQAGGEISKAEMSWAAKDLKRKVAGSFEYKDEILAKLTSELKADQQELRRMIVTALAQAWGAEDPDGYANYLKSKGITNGPEVEGWLWSQFATHAFENGVLQKYGFVIDAAQMQGVLDQVSEELPMAAMDALTAIPRDRFSPEQLQSMWLNYAVNARNAGDEALGVWLDANKSRIAESDYRAIFQGLVVMNAVGARELYLPSDGDRILALQDRGDYTAAANLLVELKAKYGDAMDNKLTKELVLQWVLADPAATFNWLNANIDSVANPEKLIAPVFRLWGVKDSEAASQAIDGIAVESLRASAMSNLIIAVAERDPNKISVESIKGMESDTVKARAIAGFVLGASRHFDDAELEIAVKCQLMQNKYNFGDLNAALANSKLPQAVVGRARELILSY